jgi:hypothetical protein
MHHEFEWPKPENKGEEDALRIIREEGCAVIHPVGRERASVLIFSRSLR